MWRSNSGSVEVLGFDPTTSWSISLIPHCLCMQTHPSSGQTIHCHIGVLSMLKCSSERRRSERESLIRPSLSRFTHACKYSECCRGTTAICNTTRQTCSYIYERTYLSTSLSLSLLLSFQYFALRLHCRRGDLLPRTAVSSVKRGRLCSTVFFLH